jgi:uncharacterized protein (UPF0332 family)
MSLEDWVENHWLVRHETSPEEIADLLGLADRDLATAQLPTLNTDWKLNIAYNAALQAATAALAAAGYKAERAEHHYRVIESLAHTLKLDHDTIILLDTFRKKRVKSDYERAGTVSESEAEEMLKLAKDLRRKVEAWLRAKYPNLIR